MILINSAEFDYATIDLSKDIFFAGDNGTGKSSTIIALFYLFSGDNNSRKLGISSDKKSFKEYYFPDERNSFLIYVFEEFFIFMYKQNGEIFKRFSKQQFHIDNIVQENGELRDFKEIQEYLKNTPLSYLAKSSEYREIIYGQNRRYLDFKITEIKNYNVFIELFNQTFNVDKSIVDANSIKRAIQKSLNIEEKNIEFNYQKYSDEIKKFQSSYLFFRKFEKERSKIEQAFKYQEELLELEQSIDLLSSAIIYRKEVENKLLETQEERLLRLERQTQQYQLKKEQKQHSLNRVRERFSKEIATLEKEIKDIENLKHKFEPQSYQREQEYLSKLPFIEKELSQKQQQLTLLEADILNTLNTIDQEVKNLEYKRDIDLKQQQRQKLEQLKAFLQEGLSERKEQLRQEKEHTEHLLESQKSKVKVSIEQEEQKLEEEKSKANEIHNEYRDRLNLFREEQFKEKRVYQEQIESQEEQSRSIKKSLQSLDEEKENLKKELQKEQTILIQALWSMRKEGNQKIAQQKEILFTTEGSFKAFLQQSGLSWEKEIYPFMDSSLLTMSTQKLEPKILNSEMPLGIDLNRQHLKSIPSQEESEEIIREAKVKKRSHFKIYKEEKNKQLSLYQKVLQLLEKRQKQKEHEQETVLKSIEAIRQEITTINSITLPKFESSLAEEKAQQLSSFTKNIKASQELVLNYKQELKRLEQEVKKLKTEEQERLQIFQKEQNNKEELRYKAIEKWFKEEKASINQEIETKQKNRASLSKDELIGELKSAINSLKQELKKANNAHYYLEEYQKVKSFMDSFAQKQSRLIISRQNKHDLEERLTQKHNDIIKSEDSNEKAIDALQKSILKLKQGVEKSQNLKLSEGIEAQESERYLIELIDEYKLFNSNYRETKINLKERLSQINNLKNNPFNEIAFKMENFSIFERLSQDNETLERLYELKDFKEKQFEPLKQATNEEYLNFIKNEIPSKLGSLSHSEDKFQEQVKKINKNLSTIDFSIVQGIKIKTEVGNERSIMALLNEMNTLVQNLTISDDSSSLFFDKPKTNQDLQKIAIVLDEIKTTLKGGAITLLDTIDLSLEFVENGTTKSHVTQIKNDSSTGGTILLKMALAISILGLYTQEKESTFFLILDEVSRLHSHNQDLLRSFANSRGFRIVFVTPEPVYAKPDEIKYYKFMRREDNRFEVISLNV